MFDADFCAFCLSGVPLVGLIGPDLQQFKRKLHKKRSPAGCWGRGLALAAAGSAGPVCLLMGALAALAFLLLSLIHI